MKGHDNFKREFPLLSAVDRCANRKLVLLCVVLVMSPVVCVPVRGGASSRQSD